MLYPVEVVSHSIQPVLVHAKPGMIHFWSESSSNPDDQTPWSGLHSIRLKTQKHSVGSSSLQPVSGMQYIHHRDGLVVSLVDGSFYIVHGIATDGPVLGPIPDGTSLDSATLSTTVRGVFSRIERDLGVTFSDAMRTSGMVLYDNGLGSVVWIHEQVSSDSLPSW